jgi:hypothetical protein
MQQLQPLGQQLHIQRGYTGEIAARTIEAGDQPQLDRVERGGEDDRNSLRRRLCSIGRELVRGDHRHLPAHQVGRQRRQPLVMLVGPAVFQRDVAPLHIPGLAQSLTKCRYERRE